MHNQTIIRIIDAGIDLIFHSNLLGLISRLRSFRLLDFVFCSTSADAFRYILHICEHFVEKFAKKLNILGSQSKLKLRPIAFIIGIRLPQNAGDVSI